MTLQQELAFYRDEGLNPIALKSRDKTPDFTRIPSWMPYQTRQSTPEEQKLWWPDNSEPFLNVGLVTGTQHDKDGMVTGHLVVIDIDDEEAYRALWDSNAAICDSATVETGKGFHIYLRTPEPCGPTFTLTFGGEGLHHVKADAGYVVAPPSIHPSGRVYTWTNRDIKTVPLEEIVQQLEEAGFAQKANAGGSDPDADNRGVWGDRFAENITQGGRADHVSRLTGFLRGPITSEAVTRELMRSWNKDHCNPPLTDREVDAIVHSMYQRYKPWEDDNAA